MRKIVKFLIGFITLFLVSLYLFSTVLLTQLSNYLIDSYASSIKFENTEYERPVFNSAQIIGLTKLKWDRVQIKNRKNFDSAALNSSNDEVRIDEVWFSTIDLSRRLFNLSIKGLTFKLKNKENELGSSGEIVQLEEFNISIPLDLNGVERSAIGQRIKAVRDELSQILTLGATRAPLSLSGKIRFKFRNREQICKITTNKEGDEYKIILDESDLLKISSFKVGAKLNSAELTVISHNPFAVLSLLQLSDKSRDIVKIAHLKNPKVSEDAYRHTLWSYLITKKHGAKLVPRYFQWVSSTVG